jgi:hypothetical protein
LLATRQADLSVASGMTTKSRTFAAAWQTLPCPQCRTVLDQKGQSFTVSMFSTDARKQFLEWTKQIKCACTVVAFQRRDTVRNGAFLGWKLSTEEPTVTTRQNLKCHEFRACVNKRLLNCPKSLNQVPSPTCVGRSVGSVAERGGGHVSVWPDPHPLIGEKQQIRCTC